MIEGSDLTILGRDMLTASVQVITRPGYLEQFHGSAFCRVWILFAAMRPKLGSRCVAPREFGNTTDFVCVLQSEQI